MTSLHQWLLSVSIIEIVGEGNLKNNYSVKQEDLLGSKISNIAKRCFGDLK
jgi:hypothetical protein